MLTMRYTQSAVTNIIGIISINWSLVNIPDQLNDITITNMHLGSHHIDFIAKHTHDITMNITHTVKFADTIMFFYYFPPSRVSLSSQFFVNLINLPLLLRLMVQH